MVVGEGVTHLGRNLCTGCVDLETVTLPSTICSLGYYNGSGEVFASTPAMKTINISAATPPAIGTNFGSKTGDAASDNITWAANITLNLTGAAATNACKYANHAVWRLFEHGAAAGYKYFGKAVPTSTTGYPTGTAVSNAFRFYMDCNKKLTVTKTGSATNITSDFGSGGANQPWKNIGMTSVEIGAGIQETGKDMFSSNNSITTMKFPAGFKKLGTSTCNQCTQINSIDMTALTGGSADVPEILNDRYNITKEDISSAAKRGKITLLIQDGMVCHFSTGAATGNKNLWNDYIIPQLMFKFEDNK
jgi:hypothetical protein